MARAINLCPCLCHGRVVEVRGYVILRERVAPHYCDPIAAMEACVSCAFVHDVCRETMGHQIVAEHSPRR